MVSTRSARALRGGAFALVATVSAAAAHTLAGGGAPSALFCFFLAALSAPAATALAGTKPALWRTASAVGGVQALFHAAFATAGDLGAWDAAAAHVHGAAPALPGPAGAAPGSGWAFMTVAHALAAAVTMLAVHRGERTLRAVLGWILPRMLRRFAVAPAPVRPGTATTMSASVPLPRPRPGAAAVTRRGPPTALASASPA